MDQVTQYSRMSFSYPRRVFLDSSVLQALHRNGEFVYDGGEIPRNSKFWRIPEGVRDLAALRDIMLVGARGAIELVLSQNSLEEVVDASDSSYLRWAFEVAYYWQDCLASYREQPPFSGWGANLAVRVEGSSFGYLSTKDKKLVRDAVVLECHAFLTLDLRLTRNAPHLEQALGIKVLRPANYWCLLRPWAALFV